MPSEARKRRRWLTLGTAVPLILAASVAAEIGMRAVSIERLAFRSTEAMRGPVPGAGPFVSGGRYWNDRAYGDLAALANLRRLRQYRREVFTTDAWGYRNVPAPPAASPPAAILLGDSFGVGAGTEDSQTLPAHLGQLWGRSVYNASAMAHLADVKQIHTLVRRLEMCGGLVLYQYLERQDLPSPPVKRRRPYRLPGSGTPGGVAGRAREIFTAAGRLWDLSRSRILAQRAYRFFQDDRILPNPYARNAVVRRLVNGREMLFLPVELELHRVARPVGADYWTWLERELARDGLRLLVLLVPNKYTVYGPLLADPPAQGEAGADYLDRLEREILGAGVPVVNLKNSFRVRAARDLPGGSYLYWLDDTHWNGRGMGVAAEEIARASRRFFGPRSPGREPRD